MGVGMNKIARSAFGWLASQSKTIMVIVATLAISGWGTTAVMAAIPDAVGILHGCRTTATGTMRIIDSASQSCTVLETAVNWNQGAQGTFVSNLTNADLVSADLRYKDFANRTISGINLTNSQLSGADFTNSHLSNALVESIDAVKVNFTGAVFTNVSFNQASFRSSNFTNVDLSNTNQANNDLRGSNLTGANLSNSDIYNTLFATDGSEVTTFTSTNLTNVAFDSVDFTGTSLTGATLTGATWTNVLCPDGTNSDSHSNTCSGHLNP